MNYKDELNPEQYEAVITKDGPLLVLAGAGSGKTRVITYRIAYMIENYEVNPYNILAITFTNKAAGEMQTRIEKLLGDKASGMWVGTFHKICGRMLRMFPEPVGFDRNFVVYDEDDCLKIIKETIKQLDLDPKNVSPRTIKTIISKAKEKLLNPGEFDAEIDKNNPMERYAAKIYHIYQEKLVKSNAMDFDDMIVNAVRLLETTPDAYEYFTNKFKYILVDEYQDTNMAQYKLVSLLAKSKNLCVVGDDDQSIYAFRGADVTNILNFEKEYKNCKVIRLEQNYRSTSYILDCANGVIKNNPSRKAKKLWTAKEGGDKVIRYTGESQNDESAFVSREIQKLTANNDYSYGEITVLYRQNSLSQNIESSLVRNGIPYKVFGGFKFFNREEIKYLISYLRLFQNPNDDVALKNIINVPARKIGEKSIENAEAIATREHCSMMKVISKAKTYTELSRCSESMESFASMFYMMMFEKDSMTISEFTEKIINEIGLIEMYKNSHDESDKDRIDNLKEFLNVAKEFEKDAKENEDLEDTFTSFLEYLALSSDQDKEGSDPDNQNYVKLMTIHAAKGLEFPVVFVIGMEETLFPSAMSADEPAGVEEERRLCYVAITRAINRLYLTNASERMTFGQTKMNCQSRFIGELPAEKIKTVDFRGNEISADLIRSRNSFSGSSSFGGSYNKYYNDKTYLNYGHKEDYEAIRTVKSGEKLYGSKIENSPVSSGTTGPAFGKSIKSLSDVEKFKELKAKASEGDKDFKVGDRVYHNKFGEGVVLKVEEDASKSSGGTIEIEFEMAGMKRLAIAYACLKKI